MFLNLFYFKRRIVKPKVRNILYYQDERYQRPPRLDRRIGEVFEDYGSSGYENFSSEKWESSEIEALNLLHSYDSMML